jgi:hypothetical protein
LDLTGHATRVERTVFMQGVNLEVISATNRQIDRLVSELYDLTDDEIGIVERATAR